MYYTKGKLPKNEAEIIRDIALASGINEYNVNKYFSAMIKNGRNTTEALEDYIRAGCSSSTMKNFPKYRKTRIPDLEKKVTIGIKKMTKMYTCHKAPSTCDHVKKQSIWKRC